MDLERRKFLKGLGLIFTFSLLPFGLNGWAGGLGDLSGNDTQRRKKLIVLFQRGAVDGLSVVVPYGEPSYYDMRPNIAIPSSGGEGGILDLDGYFGLHPALNAVLPLWSNKSLSFVHACGSPDPSRSHFDAQAFMECGTPGDASTPDGWMNRLLAVLPGPHTPTQAVSLGPILPRIFKGKMNVSNFSLGKNAASPMALDRPAIANAFDSLYNGNDPLSQAYQEGQLARKQIMSDLQAHMMAADNGAPPPSQFAQNTQKLAQLMADDPNIQLAFLDLGGWDTHVNQGSSTGQLAGHLKALGEGLYSLSQGLGDAYQDTVLIVISEFGRTVHENGDLGTDHGHGNVMWVMGGSVQGGKIYGQWPGLAKENLYEERDLAVTTDFRTAIASILTQHLNIDNEQLNIIFPGMPQQNSIVVPFRQPTAA